MSKIKLAKATINKVTEFFEAMMRLKYSEGFTYKSGEREFAILRIK